MAQESSKSGQVGVEVTPEMIAAGKGELSSGFGGETENLGTNYDEVAEAVFRVMFFASSQRSSS